MELGREWKSVKIGTSVVELRRLESGVIDIRGETLYDVQKGLGFAHSIDRLMQMLVTRIVGRGELTKYFLNSEEGYAIDFVIRKLAFRRDIFQDLHHLTPEALKWAESYCEGVNAYMEQEGLPKLCKLFKVKTEKWHVSDTMLMIKTLSYLGIAQQQERIERLIIHAVKDGVAPEKLEKIFGISGLDQSVVEMLKKVHLVLPYFDNQMRFQPFQTTMSNNWVVAPHKSASNCPLLCVDPHLQVNRLPSTWYEAVGQWGDGNYQMGITLPGFPGWIMGKTPHISASFTYGMFDTIDFFFEEIKNGKYRRGEEWIPLTIREEKIQRKNKGLQSHYFFESDAGVIERERTHSPFIKDGLYLSMAWSNLRQGPSPILNCLMHLWSSKTVDEAQMYLWEMTLPCNWVIADTEGNIGLQQSGKVPKRKKSGLLPLPAWDKENLWQGYYMGTDLVSEINPERGFCLSANDSKNRPDRIFSTINLPEYRFRRLQGVLSENKKFTLEEMQELQNDCYSVQAEDFMEQIKTWIPDTPTGKILKEWDLKYDKNSVGATLFEVFYINLSQEVFSPVFGKEVWEVYGPGHAFFGFNFGNFDKILLSDDPSFFGKEGKKALFQRILQKTLKSFEKGKISTWGEKCAFNMNYLLFDGKMPKFLGFDIGPVQLNGNRATIDTFQIYREGKRKIVTSASYRMVTDLNVDAIHSALAGGVSEKKRSPYYKSDVEIWKTGKLKKIAFDPKTNSFTITS